MVANFSSHVEVLLNDMKFNILEPNELARKCYNKYNNLVLSITTEKSRKFSHDTNANIQIFVLEFNLPATYGRLYRSSNSSVTNTIFQSASPDISQQRWDWQKNNDPDIEQELLEVAQGAASVFPSGGDFLAPNRER